MFNLCSGNCIFPIKCNTCMLQEWPYCVHCDCLWRKGWQSGSVCNNVIHWASVLPLSLQIICVLICLPFSPLFSLLIMFFWVILLVDYKINGKLPWTVVPRYQEFGLSTDISKNYMIDWVHDDKLVTMPKFLLMTFSISKKRQKNIFM